MQVRELPKEITDKLSKEFIDDFLNDNGGEAHWLKGYHALFPDEDHIRALIPHGDVNPVVLAIKVGHWKKNPNGYNVLEYRLHSLPPEESYPIELVFANEPEYSDSTK